MAVVLYSSYVVLSCLAQWPAADRALRCVAYGAV